MYIPLYRNLIGFSFHFKMLNFSGDIPQDINKTTMVFIDTLDTRLHVEAGAIR